MPDGPFVRILGGMVAIPITIRFMWEVLHPVGVGVILALAVVAIVARVVWFYTSL